MLPLNALFQAEVPDGLLWDNPFSSSHTFADLDDDIVISCPTCPDGYTGYPSIYAYDETAPGLFDDINSYIGVNDLSESFAHKKGYYVYTGDSQTMTLV